MSTNVIVFTTNYDVYQHWLRNNDIADQGITHYETIANEAFINYDEKLYFTGLDCDFTVNFDENMIYIQPDEAVAYIKFCMKNEEHRNIEKMYEETVDDMFDIVESKQVWGKKRYIQLLDAIKYKVNHEKQIPEEWVHEYNELREVVY